MQTGVREWVCHRQAKFANLPLSYALEAKITRQIEIETFNNLSYHRYFSSGAISKTDATDVPEQVRTSLEGRAGMDRARLSRRVAKG